MIRVLVVPVSGEVQDLELADNPAAAFERVAELIDGYLEPVHIFQNAERAEVGLTAWFDEDASPRGLPVNPLASVIMASYGAIQARFFGTVVFTGFTGSAFASLADTDYEHLRGVVERNA